jgi:hypothetical protein
MLGSQLTMAINANWKARFLLKLVGAVKVSGLQSFVANLSNRVIAGRWAALVEGVTSHW